MTNPTTQTQARKALLDAALHIEKKGLSKGRALGPDGSTCAVAAIHELAENGHAAEIAQVALAQHLKIAPRDVAHWSDAADRTPAEVARTLRQVAATLNEPPDLVVTGGATGLKVTSRTPPTRIGNMKVSGPGSIGIDLAGDDDA